MRFELQEDESISFSIYSFFEDNVYLYTIANLFLIFSLYLLFNLHNFESNFYLLFCVKLMVLLTAIIFFFIVAAIYNKSKENRLKEDLLLKPFNIPIYSGGVERTIFVYPFMLLAFIYYIIVSYIINNLLVFFAGFLFSVLMLIIIISYGSVLKKRKRFNNELCNVLDNNADLLTKYYEITEKGLDDSEILKLQKIFLNLVSITKNMIGFETNENLTERTYFINIMILYILYSQILNNINLEINNRSDIIN